MKTMRNTLGTTAGSPHWRSRQSRRSTRHPRGRRSPKRDVRGRRGCRPRHVCHQPVNGLVLHPQALGPNRGTPFIVDGKIFPGGTLETGSGVGDPNQPGSIGSWMCRGTFTSTLATEDIGFDTVQMFQFGDGNNIWTEGLEGGLGKIGVTTHRTIVGGTGRFKGAEGEVTQQALGTNVTGTPNIRLPFQIVKH